MGIRVIDVVRLSVGALDLLAARKVAAAELGYEPGGEEVRVFRVLGGRQIIQATMNAARGFRIGGIVVDSLHLLSMVGLAVAGPKRTRRAALTQSGIAAVFIFWGGMTVRRR